MKILGEGGLFHKLIDLIDPDGALTPAEIQNRADLRGRGFIELENGQFAHWQTADECAEGYACVGQCTPSRRLALTGYQGEQEDSEPELEAEYAQPDEVEVENPLRELPDWLREEMVGDMIPFGDTWVHGEPRPEWAQPKEAPHKSLGAQVEEIVNKFNWDEIVEKYYDEEEYNG